MWWTVAVIFLVLWFAAGVITWALGALGKRDDAIMEASRVIHEEQPERVA